MTPSGNINVIEEGILQRFSATTIWKDDENIVIKNEFNGSQHISISPLGDVVSGTRVEFFDQNNTSNSNLTTKNDKGQS